MERTHFKEILESDNCLLLRWTDDFLLVTTSEDCAVDFLAKLQSGFPEYGCEINMSKSRTNLKKGIFGKRDILKRVEGQWFPWCNLLLDMTTLEVRFSYDRYIGMLVFIFSL